MEEEIINIEEMAQIPQIKRGQIRQVRFLGGRG